MDFDIDFVSKCCNIDFELLHVGILHQFRANLFEGLCSKILVSKYRPKLGDFDIDIGIDIEMAQSAISFSVLVLKYSFHIIDFDIGFEIDACQPEILISNLNEQFRTALTQACLGNFLKCPDQPIPRDPRFGN